MLPTQKSLLSCVEKAIVIGREEVNACNIKDVDRVIGDISDLLALNIAHRCYLFFHTRPGGAGLLTVPRVKGGDSNDNVMSVRRRDRCLDYLMLIKSNAIIRVWNGNTWRVVELERIENLIERNHQCSCDNAGIEYQSRVERTSRKLRSAVGIIDSEW